MTARSTSLFSMITEFDDAGLGGWELPPLTAKIESLNKLLIFRKHKNRICYFTCTDIICSTIL